MIVSQILSPVFTPLLVNERNDFVKHRQLLEKLVFEPIVHSVNSVIVYLLADMLIFYLYLFVVGVPELVVCVAFRNLLAIERKIVFEA